MSTSRAILSCLGFVLLQIVSGPIWAALNNELRPRDSFTAQVLADRVDLGNRSDVSQGGVNLQIHLNFSKVVEQNFAMLDEGATTRIVNGLTHRELTDLAQLYVNSVADGGRRGLLLQILSMRLDANALARLSRYFGYDGTLSAIQEAAPSKALAFALAVGGGVVEVVGPVATTPPLCWVVTGSERVGTAILPEGPLTVVISNLHFFGNSGNGAARGLQERQDLSAVMRSATA